MKKWILTAVGSLLLVAVQAQKNHPAVDKAVSDPDRKTESGKADHFRSEKTRVTDDSSFQANPPAERRKPSTQKRCGGKKRRSG